MAKTVVFARSGVHPQQLANPLAELATVAPQRLTPAQRARHRHYSLLTLAIVEHYFNGNKYGAFGTYDFTRDRQRLVVGQKDSVYEGPRRAPASSGRACEFDYLGHNIAAIAVHDGGRVIDFAMNHNDAFDSSVEHAESRLVRRLYSLTQLDRMHASRPIVASEDYGKRLTEVTVYTSLEPCAQCAGIMALGGVKTVVYLQTDPGMQSISNILYNLSHPPSEPEHRPNFQAPRPVRAASFGFEHMDALDTAFKSFRALAGPWYTPPAVRGRAASLTAQLTKNHDSVTSFLCSDAARKIFAAAREELEGLLAKKRRMPASLRFIGQFYRYATSAGARGMPHRQ